MRLSINVVRFVLIGLVVWTFPAEAARKNKNSLDWDPKHVISDSVKFGSIIPDGDVYIVSVDSVELKMNSFHVTNDVKDDLYYGELRLPAGYHTLVVYSIKPMKSRNITAERGGAYAPGRSGTIKGATGGESDQHVVTKGGSGSKLLWLEINVSARGQYVIKAGKTIEDWKVISGATGKKIDVKFVPVFPSDE